MHYQKKIDKIFAKGDLWEHRTLRTLFDPYSSEYNRTSMERKIEILKVILENDINLSALILEYKDFYLGENKQDVVNAVEDGLINLISSILNQ